MFDKLCRLFERVPDLPPEYPAMLKVVPLFSLTNSVDEPWSEEALRQQFHLPYESVAIERDVGPGEDRMVVVLSQLGEGVGEDWESPDDPDYAAIALMQTSVSSDTLYLGSARFRPRVTDVLAGDYTAEKLADSMDFLEPLSLAQYDAKTSKHVRNDSFAWEDLRAADYQYHQAEQSVGEAEQMLRDIRASKESGSVTPELRAQIRDRHAQLEQDSMKLSRLVLQKQAHMLGLRLTATVLDVLQINAPQRFIVEERNEALGPAKKGQIPRSDRRPLYRLLDKTQVRKIIRRPETLAPDGPHVPIRTPHEKRGHFRQYPDDPERYPNAHGRVVWIKPSWVGPREAVEGRKRFRVILGDE